MTQTMIKPAQAGFFMPVCRPWPADDGPRQALLGWLHRRPSGGGGLSADQRRLHRRQQRLLPELDLHGPRPKPDLGLWRFALLRADGLLRRGRLQLRHPHHQFRRSLWPGPRRCGGRRVDRGSGLGGGASSAFETPL